MKKKNLAALLMAGAMCFGLLAGCSDSQNGQESTAPSEPGTQASAPAETDNQGNGPAATGASGTFKLGGIGPLTGDAAIYGNAAMNGAQIAVDEINALGGAIQFEFEKQDDEDDPEKSLNAYNTLMDHGMQVLVGTVTTQPAIAVSAQAFQDRDSDR